MNLNIAYQTDQLVRYFSRNRIAWPQFYESERTIIGQLGLSPSNTILDIGCGCGGLGLALRERFGVEHYTGVEINPLSAEAGRAMNPQARILCGDILQLNRTELGDQQFDVVFSLSCVDWNVEFADMLAAAWERVAPGGHLVATFRLTDGQGCNDPERSYQYINFDGVREGERAAYVVLNARDLMAHFVACNPSLIRAYGYWGVPSATAITPFQRLCFCAFSVQKRAGDSAAVRFELNLPREIVDALELA
jgi:SAM-dependent methyltransferase